MVPSLCYIKWTFSWSQLLENRVYQNWYSRISIIRTLNKTYPSIVRTFFKFWLAARKKLIFMPPITRTLNKTYPSITRTILKFFHHYFTLSNTYSLKKFAKNRKFQHENALPRCFLSLFIFYFDFWQWRLQSVIKYQLQLNQRIELLMKMRQVNFRTTRKGFQSSEINSFDHRRK